MSDCGSSDTAGGSSSSSSDDESTSSSEEEQEDLARRRRKRRREEIDALLLTLASCPVETAPGRKDGRKSGKPRFSRWGSAAGNVCLEPLGWGEWRHSSLHADWKRLLYEWADDTRGLAESWHATTFRQEFGMSRSVFDELEKVTAANPAFANTEDREPGNCCRGTPTQPLRQKLAAAVHMLTTNCSVRKAGQMAGVSKTCVQSFFHPWLALIMETEYHKHVYLPQGADLARIKDTYRKLGFPGAVCSTDGVHVFWANCPTDQLWLHCSAEKGNKPTRVFNASVAHTGEILYVPRSLGGRNNDKTCARVHRLLLGLQDRSLYGAEEFTLYRLGGLPPLIHKGLYSICDGGYHEWRAIQFPAKLSSDAMGARWSKRLESVRKDVECCFGRLKRRFRILGSAVKADSAEKIDNIFCVCSMLHNMQLRHDRMHMIGSEDSHWVEADHTLDGQRVMQSRWRREPMAVVSDDAAFGDTAVERDPEWHVLRSALRDHYAVAFRKREILWPKSARVLGLGLRAALDRQSAARPETREEAVALAQEQEEGGRPWGLRDSDHDGDGSEPSDHDGAGSEPQADGDSGSNLA